MKKKVKKLAEGGTTGNYGGTFGQSYSADNPYTLGMTGERLFDLAKPSQSVSDLLVQNTYKPKGGFDIWQTLSPEAQKYYIKKGSFGPGAVGLTDPTSPDHNMSEERFMGIINDVMKAKGSAPITSVSQIEEATAPLIARRNKRGMGGLGGLLGTALPLAGMLIPGLGWAGSAALGALGGAMSGGGRGALIGGLTGGIGAKLGGATMLGKFGGAPLGTPVLADQVLRAPGTSSFSVSNLFNSPKNVLSTVGSLAKAIPMGGANKEDPQGMSAQEQQALYQQMLQQQQRPQGSIFMQGLGRYAKGGSVTSCMGMNMGGYAKGRMVEGPGDGMSDDIPTTIDGAQPAALSDGEHVVPALQVSMLGRGSGKAGSDRVSELVLKEIERMYGKGVNPKKLQAKAMKQDGN